MIDPHRSFVMSRVRGKDTKPELAVRRLVHSMGYRYRLHRRDLPGTPDLAFPARKKVIFVHGCFWHHHDDSSCKLARLPKSRVDFWTPKIIGNAERDRKNQIVLESAGWSVLIVWECELKDASAVKARIQRFLDA